MNEQQNENKRIEPQLIIKMMADSFGLTENELENIASSGFGLNYGNYEFKINAFCRKTKTELDITNAIVDLVKKLRH